MCPIDQATNDFPKKLNGTNEDIDLYINCMNDTQIFYYGHSVLEAYIPSLIRGHNIIKTINGIDPELIFDIDETSAEIMFKFKYKDSDQIIPLLKPRTLAAGRSPFSSRNLPKSDYTIPDEELQSYKDIIANLPRERSLRVGYITNQYLKSLCKKKGGYEKMKEDMKLNIPKGKEYIHSIGKWDEYIKYIETELDGRKYDYRRNA